MLRSDVNDRLGRVEAGPALARVCAHPTEHLVLFDLAGHPLTLTPRRILAGSHSSKKPAKATLDDSFVYFALTLGQRRIQYVLFLGRKRPLDVCFETPEKEWTENVVQFVDERGIAGFGEAVGKGWDLEPVVRRMRKLIILGESGAYESWKAATSSKISGRIKLRRDQSSAKLF